MKLLKALLVGFVVSYVGSIPLGYLNLVGFSIYESSGFWDLILFLMGVILVEAVVISATFYFAALLSKKQKLQLVLKLFSNVFLIVIGLSLLFASRETQQDIASPFQSYAPFARGILLSTINFFQLPFWIGWNIYMLSSNKVEAHLRSFSAYLLGTLSGTTAGMLTFILALAYFSDAIISDRFSLQSILGTAFMLLGLVQLFMVFKKRFTALK